ncbi:MAG: phosphoglucosamine mutase [Saprospiraceae bacterium]|nr:phosphoglucosamine mutase [Saprospiraceae bacterium]
MALIKSISGIRGTIGGMVGENLTPQDIVACTAAFGYWTLQKTNNPKIVVGRDARVSGQLVNNLVVSTLQFLGISVVDLGLSTTPTVEVAVTEEKAGAGIVLTASHNPKQWNALKFLNEKGEFISAQDGEDVLELIEAGTIVYPDINKLGTYSLRHDYIHIHIQKILDLPLVNVEAIKAKRFKIVVDAVNSTGALALPPLLEELGCEVILINGEPNGEFAHNPEPLPEHLSQLCFEVVKQHAHLGICVDPDVDRLAFVSEDGEPFGEEYSLVAVADYVLKHTPGATVSNLSSTRALRDVTQRYGQRYLASAVGEVNVVAKMKEFDSPIGGEGNGGIIYPALHYGRDAMVGVALFLSHLAEAGKTMSQLRHTYPSYHIIKSKIELTPDIDYHKLIVKLSEKYQHENINTIDGLKIDLEIGWVHLRKSNTEPIIRIYAEGSSEVIADNLADKIKSDMNNIIRGF